MNVVLLGCGNIGSLLLRSWIESGNFNQLVVIDPNLENKFLKEARNIKFLKDTEDLPDDFIIDVVVIAIKPQILSLVLPRYKKYSSALFISLAAAVPISKLQEYLGKSAKIMRIMPNIAMKVGYSSNLVYSPPECEIIDQDIASKLFVATGELITLEKEEWLEILTPVSGSGPAYFYLLAQLMVDYASNHGIPVSIAYRIIQQTLFGSGLLALDLAGNLRQNSFVQLKETVVSKNGVTEAALSVLEKDLPSLFEKAMTLAVKRSKELRDENCS